MAQQQNVEASWIACPDCDWLYREIPLRPGEKAECARCGAGLYRDRPDSLNRALALALASLALFVVANVYPFMTFELEGQSTENRIISGVLYLWNGGSRALASLIFFASILAPLLKIAAQLYVLLPIRFDFTPPAQARVSRFFKAIEEWGMLEVYMLGVMVAIIKLSQMAGIVLGPGFYAFSVLMLTTTWSTSTLDPRLIWSRLPVR